MASEGKPVLHNDNEDSDDESDDDYVPSDHDSVSEEENSGDEEDLIKSADKSGREKNLEFLNDEKSVKQKEKEKTHADNLWSDFLSDVNTPPNKKSTQSSQSAASTPISNGNKSTSLQSTKTSSLESKIFSGFSSTPRAGSSPSTSTNSTKNTSESPQTPNGITSTPGGTKRGGLNAVLGFINKKQKVSTLDKSHMDWEKYKKESGLSEELSQHNRSKNSYLEKQDFLNRTDHRQFEQERDMRLSLSSKRKTG